MCVPLPSDRPTSFTHLHSYIYRLTYAAPVRIIAVFRLLSNTSSAAVVLRNNGIGSHYRFAAYAAGYSMASPPTGFSVGFAIERRFGGNLNQFVSLSRNASGTPIVGAWYTIDATITGSSMSAGLYLGAPNVPGAVKTAVVSNLPLIASLTATDATLTGGGVAIYADGVVDFDTFSVRTDCLAGGTCGSM